MLPMMGSEGNAISWRTIHAIGLEVSQANFFIAEGPRRSNSVAHRRLLHVGRDNTHFAKTRCDFRQGDNTRAINAVIVRNQDSHVLY